MCPYSITSLTIDTGTTLYCSYYQEHNPIDFYEWLHVFGSVLSVLALLKEIGTTEHYSA